MWLYALIEILLLLAIGAQVLYLRTYSAQATRAMRVVSGVNIALLTLLLCGVTWLAFTRGVM